MTYFLANNQQKTANDDKVQDISGFGRLFFIGIHFLVS
jgi:hypothetical protein